MLLSHKLIRWLVQWALLVSAVVVALLGPVVAVTAPAFVPVVLLAIAGMAAGVMLAGMGWWWPGGEGAPRLARMAAYFVSGTVAGLVAWVRALRDQRAPVWEPTPRALGS
jgi:hypothetical protein